MLDGDAGDLEVHAPDAHSLSAEARETVGGFLVPGQESEGGEEVHSLALLGVGIDLPVGIGDFCEAGQPAAKLLLDANDSS